MKMVYHELICKKLEQCHGWVVAEDGYDEEGLPFFVIRKVQKANVHTAGNLICWGIEFDRPLSNGDCGDLFASLFAYSFEKGSYETIALTLEGYMSAYTSEDERAVTMMRLNKTLKQL